MKLLALLSVLFLNVGIAQAADLYQYTCKSAGEKRGYKGVPVQVIVRELAPAKKTTVGNWETETSVEVTILRETRLKGTYYVASKGVTKAYSEDVMYKIVSKSLGLSMMIYFDEMENDPSATFYGPGRKQEVPLSCIQKRI
jgi:dimeric dUTPase (all-alpha-NTP-PPase superfamily)